MKGFSKYLESDSEPIELEIFPLEFPLNPNDSARKQLTMFENYDRIVSNFICIKKTNDPILEYQVAEISDSGLNISEISSNVNLNQFENFEKWNSNLLTFTEINRNEEAEFAQNNPGKRQPERLLFVLHLIRFFLFDLYLDSI